MSNGNGQDLRRLFVQLVKQACERYLEAGEYGVLGEDNNAEITGIELIPAEETEEQTYSYSIRQDDGTFKDVHNSVRPFAFRLRYWNEFGDSEENPSTYEKAMGFVEAIDEVGKFITGQVDTVKACNAMHYLRGDDPS